MAANNFFGYTTHTQATPAAGYNTGVAPPTAYPTPGAATGVAVTPSVAVAAQPPPAGSVAANQFVAQSQPTAPPPQPPQGKPRISRRGRSPLKIWGEETLKKWQIFILQNLTVLTFQHCLKTITFIFYVFVHPKMKKSYEHL